MHKLGDRKLSLCQGGGGGMQKMDCPDIECLQRLVNHLTKELEAALEAISRVDRRVRSLETARPVRAARSESGPLESPTSSG
jgi:hypothetical protein